MDAYQPIYDAVRSRIGNGDVGAAIRDVILSLDLIRYAESVANDASDTVREGRRPGVLFRPTLSRDGNQWCALYGTDLATGVAGFGDTPELAMAEFDRIWLRG